MATCLIALGANLGDREATLRRALEQLDADPNTRVVAVSSFHETKPAGGPTGQPPFLNAAATIETSLSPQQCAELLHRIETALGRVRDVRWDARVLDLDLLLYDDCTVRTADLEVPHPRMSFRRFVLAPSAEVAPDMRHPLIGWTVRELLEHVDRAAAYVAVTGCADQRRTELARRLAQQVGGKLVSAAGAEGDFASPIDLNRHLSILDSRKRLIETAIEGDGFAISDFWLAEQRAVARMDLGADEFARFDAALSDAERACLPKLRIVIEPLDTPRETADDANAVKGASRREQVERAIIEESHKPGAGPVLFVAAGSIEAALAEATAAVEAMKA